MVEVALDAVLVAMVHEGDARVGKHRPRVGLSRKCTTA